MPHKILVVDDEAEIADLIETYLAEEDYTIFKFYSARDALASKPRTLISPSWT